MRVSTECVQTDSSIRHVSTGSTGRYTVAALGDVQYNSTRLWRYACRHSVLAWRISLRVKATGIAHITTGQTAGHSLYPRRVKPQDIAHATTGQSADMAYAPRGQTGPGA
eukprot:2236553-Rhodomonas_salina.1